MTCRYHSDCPKTARSLEKMKDQGNQQDSTDNSTQSRTPLTHRVRIALLYCLTLARAKRVKYMRAKI